jgi:transposase
MWPGNVADAKTLIPVVERLRSRFGISQVCVVADRGMISAETIKKLESNRYEMKYIFGVRMRNEKAVREEISRCKIGEFEMVYGTRATKKEPSPLKVKEVRINGKRYVICFNEEQARKDVKTRQAVIEHLREKLSEDRKALIGNKGFRKYLAMDKSGITIKEDKISAEAKYDGYWVLMTNTQLSAVEVALKYKLLWMVERVFRDTKSLLRTRPIFHKTDETIRGHVFCTFLALVVRAQLERELEKAGYTDFEWEQIKTDLKGLQETEITHEGKTFIVRSECVGVSGKVCQAVGVALPPVIRKK